MNFKELFIAELKAVGFSSADSAEIAAWYLGAPPGTTFPAHCQRIPLGVNGYDPSQPRNADGEWTAGGGARPREHRDKGFQDRYGNGNPDTLGSNPQMNIERGKAVFTRLARKQTGFEPHAMYRKGLGWIGVEAGTAGNPSNGYAGGSGIAHILAKHGKEGITAEVVAETLQRGEMFRNWEPKMNRANERKVTLIRGNNVAILAKSRDGRILITDYEVVKGDDKASVEEKIAVLKKAGPYHARGENK